LERASITPAAPERTSGVLCLRRVKISVKN
jgi:hypothetical protein